MTGRPHAAFTSAQAFEAVSAARGKDRSRLTAIWLFAVALSVLAMVVVGGATRLTGSGLSITQWKPVTGAVPPLSEGAWRQAFHDYQAIPQYRLVNRGMSLAAFKSIYWWEWAHRQLGRAVGLLFAAPFAVLLATRRLPRRLMGPCVALLLLGGLQGAVGWWMVASGLESRISVAPERLATHLGLALALFYGLIWTGLEAWSGPAGPDRRPKGWPLAAALFAALVFAQCLLGALVAGNRAGLVNSDWPLMNGRVVPADYWQGSVWATLAHGPAAGQFNHRLLAYGLAVFAAALALAAARSRAAPGSVRRLCLAIGALVFLQVAVGVTTLVAGVPLSLAMAHQALATLILGTAAALAWRTRRS